MFYDAPPSCDGFIRVSAIYYLVGNGFPPWFQMRLPWSFHPPKSWKNQNGLTVVRGKNRHLEEREGLVGLAS